MGDAIFAVRQRIEKQGKQDCIIFIDLEKAYDRVPRQEVWRRNREKGLPDNYVMVVQDMYEGARTRAKTNVHGQFCIRDNGACIPPTLQHKP